MNASPALRSLLETHAEAWCAREARAVKYLQTRETFADIDPRLLAPDARFAPPSELRFSSFADRTLEARRPRRLSAGRLDAASLADKPSAEVLQWYARRARPATFAHLALEGRARIEALASAYRGRLLIPGTGLVTMVAGKPLFQYVFLDRVAADDQHVAVEGPQLVLRVFDGGLDKLREQHATAVFVASS